MAHATPPVPPITSEDRAQAADAADRRLTVQTGTSGGGAE
jgi:hypothetical protein